jgi:membrane protein DedA with SNARE-associated domain
LMPYPRFLLFTAIGSAIWNGALIGFGYYLGANWEEVKGLLEPFGLLIYGLIFLLIVVFVVARLRSRFGANTHK